MDMGSSKTGHKSDGMTRMQRDSIAREQFMKKDDPVQNHSEGTATVSDPNGWASKSSFINLCHLEVANSCRPGDC